MSVSAQVGGWKPDLVEDSEKTLAGMIEKQPKLQSYKDKAYGYAVFPKITKGAIGIGGAGGKGIVFKSHEPTGQSSMSQATIGFQLGGQVFSQIIFFKDQYAYNEFTSGQYEFDASASAVAITAGVQTRVGTEGATAGVSAGPATGAQAEINYYRGMAVFIHAKGGLMYEAAIGGQKFTFEPW